ncbi:MAG: carboxymuconolactone decarboxylase family protein [Chromatiaceae bacterium]|jgi:AhpD family alkylhydroperoxidase|nr:carboxymuconolactone decarboxylase family protein [Chromatiaceae bacterium]
MSQILNDFQTQFPDIWAAYTRLKTSCDQGGPLDPKTIELIKIGISVAMEHEGGLVAHISQAKKAGAQDAEINHAIVVATSLAGFPSTLKAFAAAKNG